jgi:hypothetical protein
MKPSQKRANQANESENLAEKANHKNKNETLSETSQLTFKYKSLADTSKTALKKKKGNVQNKFTNEKPLRKRAKQANE